MNYGNFKEINTICATYNDLRIVQPRVHSSVSLQSANLNELGLTTHPTQGSRTCGPLDLGLDGWLTLIHLVCTPQ